MKLLLNGLLMSSSIATLENINFTHSKFDDAEICQEVADLLSITTNLH